MLKNRLSLVVLFAAFMLVVAACGDDDTTDTTAAVTTTAPTTTAAATTTEAPTTTAPTDTTVPPAGEPESVLACEVTDVGGVDDASFNEKAFEGLQMAEAELGAEIAVLESQDATDYQPNINAFIEQGCDVIITVGFLLADDTAQAAIDNPDQLFAIVDQAPGPFPPWADEDGEMRSDYANVRGLTFSTNQAAFLAGYLAAAVSETGVIGTFGGINIPPVTVFMDGFMRGAAHYDEVNGTETTVLGWDGNDGLFTGNFESLEDGRAFTQNLMDEGADIILPVAGPVGLGTAAAVQEANDAGANVLMIGVDADWYETAPDFRPIYLTSVMKLIEAAVFNTVSNVAILDALGNSYVGTLENEGVGLAPYHDNEDLVSAELQAELDALREAIIAGEVSADPPPPEE